MDPLDLRQQQPGESSSAVRQRVIEARSVQRNRFTKVSIHSNGQMRPHEIRAYCSLNESAEQIFTQAIKQLGLSARAHDRILKVSRTIADLDRSIHVEAAHIAEAIQYRQLDRVWTQGTAS